MRLTSTVGGEGSGVSYNTLSFVFIFIFSFLIFCRWSNTTGD